MNNYDRDEAIDFARCISCIGVVIIHVIAAYWYSTPVVLVTIQRYLEIESIKLFSRGTTEWMLCSAIDASVRFSVPVFVMISGALMLNRKKNVDFAYVIKKSTHLMQLIISWGGYMLFMISSTAYSLMSKLLLKMLF